jgi:hypothetical protein
MLRKSFKMLSILLVLALTFTSFGSAFADDGGPLFPETPAPTAETGEMTNETPTLWFVELSSAPSADGTNKATINNEQKAFRSNAQKAGWSIKSVLRSVRFGMVSPFRWTPRNLQIITHPRRESHLSG